MQACSCGSGGEPTSPLKSGVLGKAPTRANRLQSEDLLIPELSSVTGDTQVRGHSADHQCVLTFYYMLLVSYFSDLWCVQGRRADLELQQKQGKGNPEELQYKQHCAWLW